MNVFLERLNVTWQFFGSNWPAITAVSALGLSLYQCFALRRHNRLSVLPHLDAHTDIGNKENEGWLKFVIINSGLGPAVIRTYKVTCISDASKLYSPDLVIEFLKGLPAVIRVRTGNVKSGRILRSGEEMVVLSVEMTARPNENISSLIKTAKAIINENFDVSINYQSIYGKKFDLDSASDL